MSADKLSESERAKIKKKMRDARNKKKALSYEEFEKVFDLYDTDKNGRLQYCEINNFMKDLLLRIERTKKSFKKGLTEIEMLDYSREVSSLIEKYDVDRSGTLDKKEVANLLNVTLPVEEPYKLQTSVRSKSKMFEAEDAMDYCTEEAPGETCIDIDGSEEPVYDRVRLGEEVFSEEPEIPISTKRRDSDLFRRGAVKKKSLTIEILEEEGSINEPLLAQSNSQAWQSLQKQTFADWVNGKLSENNSDYKVTDLISNMGDGILLPELTKAILRKNLEYKKNAKLTFHKYENIRISLDMLKGAGCRFSIDVAGDLVSGNEKLCLSFMKILVNHFGSGSNVQKTIQPALVNVLSIMQARIHKSKISSESDKNLQKLTSKNQPITQNIIHNDVKAEEPGIPDRTKFEPVLQSISNRQNNTKAVESGEKQPAANYSLYKKLESALVPPPEYEKSKLTEQKDSPAPSQLMKKEFSPVMFELKKEAATRLSHLEKQTEESYTENQKEATLNQHTVESPTRLKEQNSFSGSDTIKHSSLVIPQFKQNVVNGVTEIINRVNKLIEEEDGMRINNLTTDWADGQIILVLTNWFCPGILEMYQYDHSLVKIGAALAVLKQQLDIETEITPMDMHMSRCDLTNFKVFLSQVLWKDRSNDRYVKTFARTPAIMKIEKEMRNVGMISASLNRNLMIADKPKTLLPSSLPTATRFRTTRVIEGVNEKLPPALKKFYQITASAPVVENTLLSTIPPNKPPRPKSSPNLHLDDPNLHLDFSNLPLDDPNLPLDDPNLLLDGPNLNLDGPILPLGNSNLPLDDPNLPLDDPNLHLDDPDLPLEDDCVLTCIPRRKALESSNLDSKPRTELPKKILDEPKFDAVPMPFPQSPEVTEIIPLSLDTSNHQTTPKLADEAHPTINSTLTKQPSGIRTAPVSATHGSAFSSSVIPFHARRGSLPSELSCAKYCGTEKEEARGEERMELYDNTSERREEDVEDNTPEDIKQEIMNIEFNKNVSKLIATFISNEMKSYQYDNEQWGNEVSPSSMKPKKKVKFNDEITEYEEQLPGTTSTNNETECRQIPNNNNIGEANNERNNNLEKQ